MNIELELNKYGFKVVTKRNNYYDNINVYGLLRI